MRLPGFTAEQAVGKAQHAYRGAPLSGPSWVGQAILPMQARTCEAWCTSGGFRSHCANDCPAGQPCRCYCDRVNGGCYCTSCLRPAPIEE